MDRAFFARRSRRGRRAGEVVRGATVLALATVAALVPACKAKTIEVAIDDPDNVRGDAVYAELDVFDALCPTFDQLVSDLYVPTHQQFGDATADFTVIGSLPKKTYGFAIVLRNANCGVIGGGCTTFDVSKSGTIDIEISGTDPGAAGMDCPAETTCTDQVCNGSGDDSGGGGSAAGGASGDDTAGAGGSGDDTSIGGHGSVTIPTSGCDPTFFNSGDLPIPKTGDARIEGPSVAAGDDGAFFITYRERSSDGKTDREILVAVGADGFATKVSVVPGLDCANGTGYPGVGYSNGVGLAISGISAACTDGAGLEDYLFDGTGTVQKASGFQDTMHTGLPDFSVPTPRGVAAVPGGNFVGAYLLGASGASPQAAYIVLTPTGAVPMGSSGKMAIDTGATHSFVAVAANDSKVGFVVDDTSGTAAAGKLVIYDAADIVTGGGSPGSFALPAIFPASVVGFGTSFFVAQQEANDFQWGIYPAGATAALATGMTPLDLKSLDVAVFGDHVFVATGTSQQVSVSRFDGVTTINPSTSANETTTTTATVIPTLSSYDGNQIAIGAGGSRVLAAWTNQKPASGGPAGGWAMYFCKQ